MVQTQHVEEGYPLSPRHSFSQPHTAYAAFTHGLSNLWLFLCKTILNAHHLLEPLEEIIRVKFIPTLTGCALPNKLECKLLGLAVRLSVLNIISPLSLSLGNTKYLYS